LQIKMKRKCSDPNYFLFIDKLLKNACGFML
jgi:hypothetical protein